MLGNLRLWQLSLGMMLFTAAMVWDIFAFGLKTRKRYLRDPFGIQGAVVLLLIGALIGGGWFLLGLNDACAVWPAIAPDIPLSPLC